MRLITSTQKKQSTDNTQLLNDLINYTHSIVETTKKAIYKGIPLTFYKMNYDNHVSEITYQIALIKNYDEKINKKNMLDMIAQQWKMLNIGTICKNEFNPTVWETLAKEEFINYSEQYHLHLPEYKITSTVSEKVLEHPDCLQKSLKKLDIKTEEIELIQHTLTVAYNLGKLL